MLPHDIWLLKEILKTYIRRQVLDAQNLSVIVFCRQLFMALPKHHMLDGLDRQKVSIINLVRVQEEEFLLLSSTRLGTVCSAVIFSIESISQPLHSRPSFICNSVRRLQSTVLLLFLHHLLTAFDAARPIHFQLSNHRSPPRLQRLHSEFC